MDAEGMTLDLDGLPAARTVRDRPPLSVAERRSAGVALTASLVLGAYGFIDGSHNTVGYLASVMVAALALAAYRRNPLHPALAGGLGGLVVGHLAGGLVNIGDDVLYNTHPNFPLLQYDHVFHASASAIAAVVLWSRTRSEIPSSSLALLFAGLGALGLGALNELVEFLSTLVHGGGHVGGYMNTGWDFVSNVVGVSGACLLLRRCARGAPPATRTASGGCPGRTSRGH